MSRLRRSALLLAPVVAIACWAPPAPAQPVDSGAGAEPISLDYAGAPAATVEVSLSFGLFSDLFGVTDAALQGVIDAAARFGKGADPGEGAAVELTAKQVAVAQKLVGIVKGSIHSLELRVYEDFPGDASAMRGHYSKLLTDAGWDRVLRVADGDDQVEVSLRRDAGGIRGAFVMASDGGDDMVLALVECELTPEKMKELTDSLTTAALDLGLGKQLERGVNEMRRELERGLK